MSFNRTISLARNIFIGLLFCFGAVHAQEKKVANVLVSLTVKNMPFNQVLSLIEKQTTYKFAYSSDLILKQKKITLTVQNMPLPKLLSTLFKDNTIDYSIIGNQIILQKAPVPKKITISGYIKDRTTGESVTGASVYAPSLKQGTNSNNYSFYSLTVKEADNLDLTVSSEGYEKVNLKVGARNNIVQNFNLDPDKPVPSNSQEDSVRSDLKNKLPNIIEISPDTLKPNFAIDTNPLKQVTSVNDSIDETELKLLMPVDTIKNNKITDNSQSKGQTIETIDTTGNNVRRHNFENGLEFNDMLGTVSSISGSGDILNSILMKPGVMAGLDASAGYFVRGGNADQNLVQMDEATLYNPSHFFGLVSILNSSAVNNGTLLKEGFPANYGDNLSSIFDVSMKDGNIQQTGGEVQVGSTASGLTLFGPIVKNKSSFLLSARRSTIDFWLKPLQTGNNYSDYYFYDVNAKINYQLSHNNRLFLSFYQGRDKSSYSRDTTDQNTIDYGVTYGNKAFTLRWNHLFSQKLFSNTSVVYNNYFQSITASQKPYYAQLYSGIRDIDLKSDLNYYPNPNHKIAIGINYLFQTLMPASVSDKELSTDSILTIDPSNIPEKYSYRLAFYIGDEMKFGQRLQVYIGVRLPMLFNYTSQYTNIEPRFSLQYLTSPTLGIKLTYTHIHQYLHQVKSYNASFPAEIWIGSSNVVKPENSKQVTFGFFKNLKGNMFRTSMEVYYKELNNQLLFKGELQPSITSDIENSLVFGKGESYGVELLLRKVQGKLTGQLAYTLSYANQQFDSLNLGKPFPFSNDRRHCLYLNASYAFNQHWEISSNLIITSGRAFTLKKSVSSATSGSDPLFDEGDPDNSSGDASSSGSSTSQIVQNNYRLSPYNRLDLSISYKKQKQLAHRVLETEWVFSVYNVYARTNTIFAYRTIDPVTKLSVVQQVSFIPVIPSLTYRLMF